MADEERSFVLRYYLYTATLSAGFVYPITTQYQLFRGLSYAEVGLVGAVFMGTWVLSEVPTGYLGDRVGRRAVLLASSALNGVVLVAMAWARTVEAFALATFGWAVAYSMRSGVGSAWLYDLLRARLDEGEYARVKGRGVGVLLGVTAVASLVGGYLARLDYTYPYLVNGVWFSLGTVVLLTLPAEQGDATTGEEGRAAFAAVRRVITTAPLRSFVPYFAVFFAFFETVDLYIQPVATDLGLSRVDLGVLYAGFYVVAGVVAFGTGWVNDRVGARAWFLTVPFLVAAVFVAAGVVPVLALPAFFVVKAANRASSPLMGQYVNDHLAAAGRATGVSAVTMVGGLAAVIARVAAGEVADVVGPRSTLALFAGGMAVLLAAFALTGSPVTGGRQESTASESVSDD